jgi:hypothetical protein
MYVKEIVASAKAELNADTFAEKYLKLENETASTFLHISS